MPAECPRGFFDPGLGGYCPSPSDPYANSRGSPAKGLFHLLMISYGLEPESPGVVCNKSEIGRGDSAQV